MSKVVVKQCDSYDLEQLQIKLEEAINLLGGWEKYIKPKMKVLLKVNLIGPKASDSAAVTHCEFVRAIASRLKKMNCEVWIGDSSGGAIAGIAPTVQAFEVSGLNKIAKDVGAIVKNFDKEGVVEVLRSSKPEEKMYLAKPAFEADFIINLPKLKTHSAGVYTGAVKNAFGYIPGLKKADYHKNSPDPKDFGEIITDINKAIKTKLHIMDGIIAMQGEGPTAGEPYDAHKIIISEDPLALDTVACSMIGIDVKDVPILHSAMESRLGVYEQENIELLGDYNRDILPVFSNFKLPKRYRSKKVQNYNALVKVIDFLKSRPKINLKVCKQCNMCVESCPVQAINKENKKIDYSRCIECMCCHELCRYQAVDLKRDSFIASVITKLYRGNYK